MTPAVMFAGLQGLLTAQTALITAITAQQPPAVAAELWTRFADDTRWIHDALSKWNALLEKTIGSAPDNPPVKS